MGICPSLSPEQRATKEHNKALLMMLDEKLKDLLAYNFAVAIRGELSTIQNRYLYNQGIIEDIDHIVHLVENNKSIKTQSLAIQTLQDELKNSCLIMQDQMYKQKNPQPQPPLATNPQKSSPLTQNQIISSLPQHTEYQKNLAQNESLVCQINIIYQRDFDITRYHNSLKLFLKWSTMFNQHFYGGFLKPIYKIFCSALYKLGVQDLDTIVDQTSVFVQFLVGVYTDVYFLKVLAGSQNGCLFKNQNVFNMIMANIFKKTKIKKFVKRVIVQREANKIQIFKAKLQELKNKDIQFFGVQSKFQLLPGNSQNLNKSTQYSQLVVTPPQPYTSILPLIHQLCQNSQTPITKLKLIVKISKQITSQIYRYYDNIQKQIPEIDPDNLTCIIMYLIVKAGRQNLYEELKIAELFTTGNCLTCISGYYLNTFNAAIQSLGLLAVESN